MTMLKIEHADPSSNQAIAFDVLGTDDTVLNTHVLRFGEHALVPAGVHLHSVSGPELAKRQVKEQAEANAAHDRASKAQAKAAGVQDGAPNPTHVDLKTPLRPATSADKDEQQRWEAQRDMRARSTEMTNRVAGQPVERPDDGKSDAHPGDVRRHKK